jgi:hypothetical protein
MSLEIRNPDKWFYCWRCGYKKYEWTGMKYFIQNRGRCFCCRIDALDIKYGPSQSAEEWRRIMRRKPPRDRDSRILAPYGYTKDGYIRANPYNRWNLFIHRFLA